MKPSQLIDYFQTARSDRQLAVIEGVQALKHAVRFEANIDHIITCDIKLLETLLSQLAPDISQMVLKLVQETPETTFAKLSPQPPRTKVIAVAKRTTYRLNQLAEDRSIVLLEDPRDLENIGAVIRVAAAANAGAVVITGQSDIWHPAAIRGAAGLQFAIPCFDHLQDQSLALMQQRRALIALDPSGESIQHTDIPQNAVLVFGTERHGISPQLLGRSNQVIGLPMKQGVSSLNLATAVAATLYQIV